MYLDNLAQYHERNTFFELPPINDCVCGCKPQDASSFPRNSTEVTSYQVHCVSCGNDGPKFKTKLIDVKGNQAAKIQKFYRAAAIYRWNAMSKHSIPAKLLYWQMAIPRHYCNDLIAIHTIATHKAAQEKASLNRARSDDDQYKLALYHMKHEAAKAASTWAKYTISSIANKDGFKSIKSVRGVLTPDFASNSLSPAHSRISPQSISEERIVFNNFIFNKVSEKQLDKLLVDTDTLIGNFEINNKYGIKFYLNNVKLQFIEIVAEHNWDLFCEAIVSCQLAQLAEQYDISLFVRKD